MYKRAMRDLRGLRVRSQERLEKLNFTIDLVSFTENIIKVMLKYNVFLTILARRFTIDLVSFTDIDIK